MPSSVRGVRVRPLQTGDIEALIPLRLALFPDCPPEEQRREITELLGPFPERIGRTACFVAELEARQLETQRLESQRLESQRLETQGPERRLVGFAEVMIRSHAEGCWEHTAGRQMGIAYLEAWWVDPDVRRTGIGLALVSACADWGRAQGCPALASDALLENVRSQAAHERVGFREVERSVHFVMELTQ